MFQKKEMHSIIGCISFLLVEFSLPCTDFFRQVLKPFRRSNLPGSDSSPPLTLTGGSQLLTVCSDSFPLLQLKVCLPTLTGGSPLLTVCSDSFPLLQLSVCLPTLTGGSDPFPLLQLSVCLLTLMVCLPTLTGGLLTLTVCSPLLMNLGGSPKKNRWSKPPTDWVLMNLVCSDSFPLLQLKDGSQLLTVC